MKKYEKYTKESQISFALGIFPTFELLKHRPKQVEAILLHSKLRTENKDVKKLFNTCQNLNIPIYTDDKTINKLSKKENCFVVGVFKKYSSNISGNKHILLDNPSDMGNLGTIMRTMLGFGITDLVITKPCVDPFNPKVVRASMGAIFGLNIIEINSLNDYLETATTEKFLFMLNGKTTLGKFNTPKDNFCLIFGNEAKGLDKCLSNKFNSVIIQHTNNIDSLNLPISVGIAIYEFTK